METLPVNRLRHFPITWFATVMGLAGLSLAWRHASIVMSLNPLVARVVAAFSAAMFLLLGAVYVAKTVKYRAEVIAEWRHPVRVNFVPALSISLILLATALPEIPRLSFALLVVGSALNLVLTLYVLSFWLNHRGFQIQHLNPAWFIPVVGNILVPLVGMRHGMPEISWFFFSVGLVFWLVLFTIVIYRIIFHEPIPERLFPTMFILIAPPAVGFLSYLTLVGSIDSLARILYHTALFLTMLLLTQAKRFIRLPFFLSWWAYSFPVAAITVATLTMYRLTGRPFFHWTSWFLLVSVTILIVILLVRTGMAVQRGQICVEEK